MAELMAIYKLNKERQCSPPNLKAKVLGLSVVKRMVEALDGTIA